MARPMACCCAPLTCRIEAVAAASTAADEEVDETMAKRLLPSKP
jgi:hypothetical protein